MFAVLDTPGESRGHKVKIYLIRHGETAKNRERRLLGRSDVPLNEKGISQSGLARDFFASHGVRFDLVYSSPLRRAVETARIVAGPQARVLTDERLLEMDYGPYEGCSLEDPAPELMEFFRDFRHNPAPEGMEPLPSVTKRLGLFLRELRGVRAGAVLISTHAIAMKGALEYLTPGSGGAYWSRYIGNCTVYAAESTDGGYGVPEEIFSCGGAPGV